MASNGKRYGQHERKDSNGQGVVHVEGDFNTGYNSPHGTMSASVCETIPKVFSVHHTLRYRLPPAARLLL